MRIGALRGEDLDGHSVTSFETFWKMVRSSVLETDEHNEVHTYYDDIDNRV